MKRASLVDTAAWAAVSFSWIAAASLLFTAVCNSDRGFSALAEGLSWRVGFSCAWACGCAAAAGVAESAVTSAIALHVSSFIENFSCAGRPDVGARNCAATLSSGFKAGQAFAQAALNPN